MAETIKTILTADGGKFRSEMTAAGKATDVFSSKMKAVAGGIVAAFGARRVLATLNNLRAEIDAVGKTAKKLGLPVEETQRLSMAADLGGASVESLSRAMTRSRMAAVEAARGSKAMAREFEVLGISAADFNALAPDQQLAAIARGFNAAKAPGEAVNAVLKVMGRGGQELLPVLRAGEDALADVSRRLNVLGGEDVAAVERMNDELKLLSANIQTNLAKSLLSLRPHIESFVGLLSRAAEGLAVGHDAAGGVGMQGGQFGGVEMLREMDALEERLEEIREMRADLAAGKGGGLLSFGKDTALRESEAQKVAALAALEKRYGGLNEETRLFAEQLMEIERLQASGLPAEEIRRQVDLMGERTQETLRAIAAEKEAAAAASATTAELEEQEKAAEKLADTLAALRGKVGKQIFDLQAPELRRDEARKQLRDILAEAQAESLDELRGRVAGAGSDEERMEALKFLDAALDRLGEIRKANQELARAEQKRAEQARQAQARQTARDDHRAELDILRARLAGNEALAKSIERQAELERAKLQIMAAQGLLDQDALAAAEALQELKEEIAAAEKARDVAANRDQFRGETNALRLELAGQKEMAEALRTELRIRSEAADFAERMGVSEAEALRILRERARMEKELMRLRAAGEKDEGKRERRGIRQADREKISAGNNLKEWQWNMARGGDRRAGGPRPTASLRNTELRRRENERANRPRTVDPTLRVAERQVDLTEKLVAHFEKIGLI